jgi:hypothetical protein
MAPVIHVGRRVARQTKAIYLAPFFGLGDQRAPAVEQLIFESRPRTTIRRRLRFLTTARFDRATEVGSCRWSRQSPHLSTAEQQPRSLGACCAACGGEPRTRSGARISKRKVT